MRKSLVLFLILLTAAIGGTCYVGTILLKEKDHVVITEKVLYGDKSAVEGVTVERNIKYDKHIRWNTTYMIGEQPECETIYDFDEAGRFLEGSNYRYSGIELYTDRIGNFDETDEPEKLTGANRAIRELLDETEPGQESSKIIELSDYLDYYEYEITIDLPGDIHHYFINKYDIEEALGRYKSNESYSEQLLDEKHIIEVMSEFFKIPVIEDHFYEIAVAKDTDGKLYGYGYGSATGGGSSGNVSMGATLDYADGFSLYSICAYTEEECYFTFNTRTWKDKIVDTSLIPGGYGIYCLPFDKEKRTIDVDSMKCVYTLNPLDYINALHYDERRDELLLFGESENGASIKVIDEDTMELKQEIFYSEEMLGASFYKAEDFMVLRYSDKLMVLSVDETDSWKIEFEVEVTEILEKIGVKYLDMDRTAFDWNGETLLIADSITEKQSYYYQKCGFYLMAFDKTGLVYFGEYASSLDTGESYDYYYSYNCMPTDKNGIKISW